MPSLSEFVGVQYERFTDIFNAVSNLKKSGKENLMKNFVNTRKSTLNKNWGKFEFAYEQYLTVKADNKDNAYFTMDMYTQSEDKYVAAKACLLGILDIFITIPTAPTDGETPIHVNVQPRRMYPLIELTQFLGVYTEWPAYRDLFELTVKNDKDFHTV